MPQQKKSLQTAVWSKNNVVLYLEQKMVIILVFTGFGSISISILVQIRTALQRYKNKLASLWTFLMMKLNKGKYSKNGLKVCSSTKSVLKHTLHGCKVLGSSCSAVQGCSCWAPLSPNVDVFFVNKTTGILVIKSV